MTNAIWFRSDLRIYDNPAVIAASENNDPVIAFYFFTPDQHRKHHTGSVKLRFMLENLVELKHDLTKLNIPLVALLASDYDSSVALLKKLCQQHNVRQVFANSEIELNEQIRDHQATRELDKIGSTICFSQDQTILSPQDVLTGASQPYRVFTPFKRAWIKTIQKTGLQSLPLPTARPKTNAVSTSAEEILSWEAPVDANQYWKPGSQEAFRRLEEFTATAIERYRDERDHPSLTATSQLSPYLAVGAISVRSCMLQALLANNFEWDSGSQGILTWINELIWREFYKHLSCHYPELSKGAAFNQKTALIPWSRDMEHFTRWKEGLTGFPLVDAGMRQLNTIGWMHNRLRMVTAMFLTKQLFIDWHLGEAYFMQKLIDGDYAANNGGWQWSASTGADSAPYFRVFNPTRQAERFDAKGDFIRHWVPELSQLGPKQIFDPNPFERQTTGYPAAMVDHRESVEHVKQAFKMAQAMEAI